MNWTDKLFSRLGYTKAQAANPPQFLRAEADVAEWEAPSAEELQNGVTLYQKLTWVQIAISHLAQTAASNGFNVFELTNAEANKIPNHPFELLLRRPNPMQSRFEFLVDTFSSYGITGNAYWYLNRTSESAPITELWTIPAHKIAPVPDGKMYLRGYAYDAGNGKPPILLPPWTVAHFKRYNPATPFFGLSPLSALATVSGGDLAMQAWNANYFSKDNGKVQGALMFSDYVPDSDWEKIKADIKKGWGGTRRAGPMLMRGSGKDVSWVSMMLSQKEMEFLESRRFNKEEIFAVFAPGLSSIIDVSATEANATVGKATLHEFAVYPLLVAVAEKITNDILPTYGAELVGEFDDPRKSDRALQLQEQEAYSKTHTINEIRLEYYGDAPLADDRGDLLLAEVKQVTTPAPSGQPDIAARPTNMGDAQGIVNEQQTTHDAATNAQVENLTNGFKSDFAKWQRKALKALKDGKSAAVKFESDEIAPDQLAALAEDLAVVTTADEVQNIFAAALKAAGEPADVRQRRRREKAAEKLMATYFERQLKRLAAAAKG